MTLTVPEEMALEAYITVARQEFMWAIAHTRGDQGQMEQRGKALDEAADRLAKLCQDVTEENTLIRTLQKGRRR